MKGIRFSVGAQVRYFNWETVLRNAFHAEFDSNFFGLSLLPLSHYQSCFWGVSKGSNGASLVIS